MPVTPVVISLPIEDRRRSYAFYRDGLGLEPIGQPVDDGVPEPLQFALNDGVRLLLVPTGGFGWVLGPRDAAAAGHSECILSLGVGTDAAVDGAAERAQRAGAEIVRAPQRQAWGYDVAFADPDGHVWMVTSEPLPG